MCVKSSFGGGASCWQISNPWATQNWRVRHVRDPQGWKMPHSSLGGIGTVGIDWCIILYNKWIRLNQTRNTLHYFQRTELALVIKCYKVTSQYKQNYFLHTVTDFHSFLFTLFFWKKPKTLLVCKFNISSPLVVPEHTHAENCLTVKQSDSVWL